MPNDAAWWTREHWTVCNACFNIVQVDVTQPLMEDDSYYAGAGWSYKCPACGWSRTEEGSVAWAESSAALPNVHASPPPDLLSKLLPALHRLGLDKIVAAMTAAEEVMDG